MDFTNVGFCVLQPDDLEVIGEEIAEEVSQTYDLLDIFIPCIENFPCLYNKKVPEYKNSIKKENAWKEVATILHMEIEECQKLWEKIRKRYTAERRNAKVPTKSGSAFTKKVESPLLKLMSFMEPHIATRTSFTNVKVPPQREKSPSLSIQTPPTVCRGAAIVLDEDSRSSTPQSPNTIASTSSPNDTRSSTSSLPSPGPSSSKPPASVFRGDTFYLKKQKHVESLTSMLKDSSEKFEKFIEQRNKPVAGPPNEDGLFANLLAARAAKIAPGKRKREFERRCFELLEEYLDDD